MRNVKDEYERNAARYQSRWRSYIQKSNQMTFQKLKMHEFDRILDVGCGTGELLSYMALHSIKVELYGLDLSERMLDVARKRLGKYCKFINGSANQLPFPNAFFDQIVSVSSFHYWSEPQVCLKEIHRILKTDNTLTLTDWCHDFFTCKLYSTILKPTPFHNFKIYGSDELTLLLEESGFVVEEVTTFKSGIFWGLMTIVARKRESL